MKSFFIILVALAAASAEQLCTPGTYYRTECNKCVCNRDGRAATCTPVPCLTGLLNHDGSLKIPLDLIQQIIPEATEFEIVKAETVLIGQVTYVQICTPNSYFRIGCKSCRCSNYGTQLTCTENNCSTKGPNHNQIGNHRVARSAVNQVCQPNSQFKEYCNSCVCSTDGSDYVCTLKTCDKNIYNQDGSFKAPLTCEPGTKYYDYCNTCSCSDDGLSGACTKMACDRDMFNKDGSLKYPYDTIIRGRRAGKEVCEPGKVFNNYCNRCICADDGSAYACTRMHCGKDLWNKDGSKKSLTVIRKERAVEEKQVCEPGKLFKEFCNDCVCSKDGATYACTKKACDENVYNRDGSLKAPLTCEPGTHFKEYCNQCYCMDDGLNAACTAMACDMDVYNKDGSLKKPISNRSAGSILESKENWGPLYQHGDSCESGKAFHSECNQCVCLENGQSAFCTLMMCPKIE